MKKTNFHLVDKSLFFFWCGKRDLVSPAGSVAAAVLTAHRAVIHCRVASSTYSNKKKEKVSLGDTFSFWCGKRDLNPYGVNHTPLKRARLPVPPLPHVRFVRNILYYTLFFQNVKPFLKKK